MTLPIEQEWQALCSSQSGSSLSPETTKLLREYFFAGALALHNTLANAPTEMPDARMVLAAVATELEEYRLSILKDRPRLASH